MFQDTTRLQGTGENLSHWSHPLFCNVWNTTRQPATGKNFSLWSHHIFCYVSKYNKIAGNGKVIEATSYFAMFQGGRNFSQWRCPLFLQCIKRQIDSRQPGENFNHWSYMTAGAVTNLSHWSHQLFFRKGHVSKYNKIAGHGKSVKPPVIFAM